MGKLKKKKQFKLPRSYYSEFILFILLIFMGTFIFWFIAQMDEEELYEDFANPKLRGTSKNRFSQVITMITIRVFGKTGMLVLAGILIILFLTLLIKEIKEFRRYKNKCRLYHERIIKDISDIYDDYEPKGLIKSIKNLFSKTKKKQYKYPTKKELKKIEKKIND
ncbi:MAG: hypothetical protein LBT27_00650, partial [Prevotellaceae bacterium]|nr:hypothetical protein [Prevotellaceae bacterium]